MDSTRKAKKYLADSNPRDLIREIKRRPGLYNKEKLEQPRREHKMQLWMEVAESLTNSDLWDSFTEEEKGAKVDEVQHKWKHLRNHFLREVKLIRSGQAHTKRKYIYYNDMEFMTPFVGLKLSGKLRRSNRSTDSMDDDDYSDNDHNKTNDETNIEYEPQKIPRRVNKVEGRKLPQYTPSPKELTKEQKLVINKFDGLKRISEKIRRPPSVPTVTQVKKPLPSISMRDGDVSFCLSLVPTMRKLDESQRLKAKIEILTILHKFVEPENRSRVLKRQREVNQHNNQECEDAYEVNYENNQSEVDEKNNIVWWT
ncbi:uncharacterized protein LOC142228633 [Haematobia irritans]|uniref:uncharacterized protein LOC142228633 n=1 Tax=Haematobia irritans TaxID=7368 RepID=UPI003F50CCAB